MILAEWLAVWATGNLLVPVLGKEYLLVLLPALVPENLLLAPDGG